MKAAFLLLSLFLSSSICFASVDKKYECEGLISNLQIHSIRKINMIFTVPGDIKKSFPIQFIIGNAKLEQNGVAIPILGGFAFSISGGEYVNNSGTLKYANTANEEEGLGFIYETTSRQANMMGLVSCVVTQN